MKHIKSRIMLVILALVALLFISVSIIVNISIPRHFEKEAKDAIEYELEYVNSFIEDAEDGEVEKMEYTAKYFSGNINYIDMIESDSTTAASNLSNNYKMSLKNSQDEILNYCENHTVKKNKCYTYRTDEGYYIFMKYDDEIWSEEYPTSIMYINIQPLVKYSRSLNWILFAVFLCVTVGMSCIGMRLGKKIESSQDTQRQFFQNSSHELKTPLMSIQGYAEGIQTGLLDPVASAGVILQEGDRMTSLVEELLAISKIDAHQLKLDMVPTDVREILYDCFRTLEPVYMKNNIELCPTFSESQVMVNCDETQLRKAFINVLSNGLRHSRSKLTVTCETKNKTAVIKVIDDGDGMSEEDLKHVFDRFYTGKEGNTGIGLALTYEIINLHGGKISAHNGDSGAEFEINLECL